MAGSPKPATRRCVTCGEPFPGDYRLCPRDGSPLAEGLPSADPLLGTVLAGTYRLGRTLARGGMGVLYEAEHLRLERHFAVKVLSEAHTGRPRQVARFLREAHALAAIRSPYVIDVVDVLQTADGRPCMVTPLLEGEDLGRRLGREGRLPLADALHIAREMCRGLTAAHASGVIHRDLKPSNVFLIRDAADALPSVRLLDFGVAKLLDEPGLTRSDAVVGTPSYMAPEQARGAREAAETADVYGVGAVLYHMLCGRPPYPAGESTSVLADVLSNPPVPLRRLAPDIPEPLQRVVEAAMVRDPAARIGTVQQLESLLTIGITSDTKRRRSKILRDTSDRNAVSSPARYGLLLAAAGAGAACAFMSRAMTTTLVAALLLLAATTYLTWGRARS